jgi:hypothetical protein
VTLHLAGRVETGVNADSLQLFAVPRETIRRLPQDLQASFTPIHLHVGSLARAETMSAKLEVAGSAAKLSTRSSAKLEATVSKPDEETEAKLLDFTPPSTPVLMDSSVWHQTNFFSPNQTILTPFGPQSYSTPAYSNRQYENEELQQQTLYESESQPEDGNNQAQQEEVQPVQRQSARKRGIQPEFSGLK